MEDTEDVKLCINNLNSDTYGKPSTIGHVGYLIDISFDLRNLHEQMLMPEACKA